MERKMCNNNNTKRYEYNRGNFVGEISGTKKGERREYGGV
jgi:hypothetical protein